jgi:hypothetical protein
MSTGTGAHDPRPLHVKLLLHTCSWPVCASQRRHDSLGMNDTHDTTCPAPSHHLLLRWPNLTPCVLVVMCTICVRLQMTFVTPMACPLPICHGPKPCPTEVCPPLALPGANLLLATRHVVGTVVQGRRCSSLRRKGLTLDYSNMPNSLPPPPPCVVCSARMVQWRRLLQQRAVLGLWSRVGATAQ